MVRMQKAGRARRLTKTEDMKLQEKTLLDPTSRRFESWSDSDSLFLKLSSYGLTAVQARIYLLLLIRGQSRASEVSKELGMYRTDVYRKLKELESLGMIEINIGSTRTYSAIEPSIAIQSVIAKMEDRVNSLKSGLAGLDSELSSYKLQHSSYQLNRARELGSTGYKVVVGRQRYYKEITEIVRNSRQEVLRVVSSNGIRRTFLSGLSKEYQKARKRGVALKMISEINSTNVGLARKLSKILDLRHLNDIHLRFIVSDGTVASLSAMFDDKNLSMRSNIDNYFVFYDVNFAQAARFIFEHLWANATPFERLESQ